MVMTKSNDIALLNIIKPFKTTWKVEVKVLHSWTQHSIYSGGDSLGFILADKMGVKIYCTCMRLFLARVKKLQVGQWRFLENFSVNLATGKYRPTSYKYKLSIISNSNFTNTSLKNVIGQTTDIGDIEVVQVLGKEKKKLEVTLTDTRKIKKCIVKVTIYATNTYSSWYYFGCVKCNFKKVTNITKKNVVPVKHMWHCDTCNQSVTNVSRKFKLHLLIKDDYSEPKVMLLDTIAEPILGVSGDVLLGGFLEEMPVISIESENNTCLSSTQHSKQRRESDIDNLSSTSKTMFQAHQGGKE
ncbi:hypothetical protein N665_0213s0017 [Sinapis alba]|nr:hypothetical protein N665_0213s0017 [Sinapis alba]